MAGAAVDVGKFGGTGGTDNLRGHSVLTGRISRVFSGDAVFDEHADMS